MQIQSLSFSLKTISLTSLLVLRGFCAEFDREWDSNAFSFSSPHLVPQSESNAEPWSLFADDTDPWSPLDPDPEFIPWLMEEDRSPPATFLKNSAGTGPVSRTSSMNQAQAGLHSLCAQANDRLPQGAASEYSAAAPSEKELSVQQVVQRQHSDPTLVAAQKNRNRQNIQCRKGRKIRRAQLNYLEKLATKDSLLKNRLEEVEQGLTSFLQEAKAVKEKQKEAVPQNLNRRERKRRNNAVASRYSRLVQKEKIALLKEYLGQHPELNLKSDLYQKDPSK